MKRIITSLLLAFASIVCFAQPNWFTITSMLAAIPDHGCVDKSAKSEMTPDLYNSLEKAFKAPVVEDHIGMIGENEFLFYVLATWQDTMPTEATIKIKECKMRNGAWNARVAVTYSQGTITDLILVIKDTGNGYLLDDILHVYENGTTGSVKKQCKDYLTEQYKDYQRVKNGVSVDTYIKSVLYGQCDQYTRKGVTEYFKEVRQFLVKYPR